MQNYFQRLSQGSTVPVCPPQIQGGGEGACTLGTDTRALTAHGRPQLLCVATDPRDAGWRAVFSQTIELLTNQ